MKEYLIPLCYNLLFYVFGTQAALTDGYIIMQTVRALQGCGHSKTFMGSNTPNDCNSFLIHHILYDIHFRNFESVADF